MKKPTASELISICGLDDLRSLAIIGLSKNAGKTTTLNHLIRAMSKERPERVLAVSSIGLDGESEDQVTGICKPRIYLPAGSLIASSVSSLRRCDALIDMLELSGIRSALGEIVIGRSLSDGYVELAGPSLASEMKLCERLLRQEDPDCLFFIDGALSRRSSAGGGITEAVVLAASYGRFASYEKLIEDLQHSVKLISLPQADLSDKETILGAVKEESSLRALALNRTTNKMRCFMADSLLSGHKSMEQIYKSDDRLLFLRGAVTESVLKNLLRQKIKNRLVLVVEDGNRLFISANSLRQLDRHGIELRTLYPLSLRMISFNPHMDDGSPFIHDGILDELRRYFSVPVYDLGPALL